MSVETTAGHETADEVSVLVRLSEMLRELLEEYGLDDTEITMDTTFHDDLELESVDLVALSGQLREHYGDRVNFATFIAERDLDEIIALTVGELVRHIVVSLRATA
ncbi:acyl carrier protein [Amycolatopsis balhimycina DSM 5908]|uniref:Acyl carrier protein n=1 Tax=Amycolatopsis balhimycina DSM 5908 TaxID=1081091 RepID=A0A428WMU6_AMYBA|nr:phosphopantetheine-binding protein [Amycolatopsis balhimycina]RSM44409.1 acyl carrier protein [Amycolatopsis balhimycina DSM 5908]